MGPIDFIVQMLIVTNQCLWLPRGQAAHHALLEKNEVLIVGVSLS